MRRVCRLAAGLHRLSRQSLAGRSYPKTVLCACMFVPGIASSNLILYFFSGNLLKGFTRQETSQLHTTRRGPGRCIVALRIHPGSALPPAHSGSGFVRYLSSSVRYLTCGAHTT
jgi:hypothetical protein